MELCAGLVRETHEGREGIGPCRGNQAVDDEGGGQEARLGDFAQREAPGMVSQEV